MNSSPITGLERFAAALAAGARRELYLTPKPGLVDRADCGSHPDLSFALMQRSLLLIEDYLCAITASLVRGEPFACQQKIAVDAEARMLTSLGTNTHKGFIFLSGMLVIARWHAQSDDEAPLRAALAALTTAFFAGAADREASVTTATNGQQARDRFSAGGIVAEAMRGYPALFAAALPAFRAALRRHRDVDTASFAMLARLMQSVEDTTSLHRAGVSGLVRVQRDGRELETLIEEGSNWRQWLTELNRSYIEMRLTMGGVADMLGLAYGYLIARGELAPGD